MQVTRDPPAARRSQGMHSTASETQASTNGSRPFRDFSGAAPPYLPQPPDRYPRLSEEF